jgi:hypothetical protein
MHNEGYANPSSLWDAANEEWVQPVGKRLVKTGPATVRSIARVASSPDERSG